MTPKHAALEKKVNAGTGRRLTPAEQAFKTRNWPKSHGHKEMSQKDKADYQKRVGRAYSE